MRIITDAQKARLPSVSAAVACREGTVWQAATGVASVQPASPAGPNTQYRVGSVTKTFLAALVLQLAGSRQIDIDEKLGTYLPALVIRHPTVRQVLSHTGGLAREIPTGLWKSFVGPDRRQFIKSLSDREQIFQPGRAFHYSNLGYSILGELVRVVTGSDPTELITTKFIQPLNLSNTSWDRDETAATGFWVDPYRDSVHAEPIFDTGAMAPATQLWSSANDLTKWGTALAGAHPSVLPPSVTESMRQLHTLEDVDDWSHGWGLGLSLKRSDDRTLAGHPGIMPGFLAALSFDSRSGVAAAVLTNSSTGLEPSSTADQLVTVAINELHNESEAEPWRVGPPCPAEYENILGRWWVDGLVAEVKWLGGRIHTKWQGQRQDSEFKQISTDHFVCVRGEEQGEHLYVVRNDSGDVIQLVRGGYPFFRTPYQVKNSHGIVY
jgi:CubicO group peptidase (beta-lactamase class C family)